MPIKYNKNQGSDDYINNVPITEQISNQDSTEQKLNDMLSNIIEEKQKLNNTSMIKMVNSLTSVTYYHIVPELSANNSIASDSSGPSDIGVETKKYQKINFSILIPNGISFVIISQWLIWIKLSFPLIHSKTAFFLITIMKICLMRMEQ